MLLCGAHVGEGSAIMPSWGLFAASPATCASASTARRNALPVCTRIPRPPASNLKVKEEFFAKWEDKAAVASAHSMDKSFGPRLKYWMEYCEQHPEELSKVAAVQKKVGAQLVTLAGRAWGRLWRACPGMQAGPGEGGRGFHWTGPLGRAALLRGS